MRREMAKLTRRILMQKEDFQRNRLMWPHNLLRTKG
jgi:hypothetical protein